MVLLYIKYKIWIVLITLENGVFKEEKIRKLLQNISSDSNISGSRNLEDNICDFKAQLASNKKGIDLLAKLILDLGLNKLIFYMIKIQKNAERNVKNALIELSLKNKLPEIGTIEAKEYMDEGSFISLKLTIGKIKKIE